MKKLIKHFIDRADGFSFMQLNSNTPTRIVCNLTEWPKIVDFDRCCLFPLFLQRVRIGINKRYQDNCEEGVSIDMSSASIGVWSIAEDGLYREAPFWFVDNDNSEEKTLVAALTWIMEQEEEANERD